MKYAINSKEKVRAMGTFPVSSINATAVCKKINRKKFADAKKFLEKLIDEKVSIRGKYFTKTSKEILKLLNQLESNAKSMNVDTSSLNLFISAHRGATMYRGKRDRN